MRGCIELLGKQKGSVFVSKFQRPDLDLNSQDSKRGRSADRKKMRVVRLAPGGAGQSQWGVPSVCPCFSPESARAEGLQLQLGDGAEVLGVRRHREALSLDRGGGDEGVGHPEQYKKYGNSTLWLN